MNSHVRLSAQAGGVKVSGKDPQYPLADERRRTNWAAQFLEDREESVVGVRVGNKRGVGSSEPLPVVPAILRDDDGNAVGVRWGGELSPDPPVQTATIR